MVLNVQYQPDVPGACARSQELSERSKFRFSSGPQQSTTPCSLPATTGRTRKKSCASTAAQTHKRGPRARAGRRGRGSRRPRARAAVEGHDNLSQQGSKRPNPDRLAPTSLPTLEASPEPREVARATRLCENGAKMAAMRDSKPNFSSNLSSRRAPFGSSWPTPRRKGRAAFCQLSG